MRLSDVDTLFRNRYRLNFLFKKKISGPVPSYSFVTATNKSKPSTKSYAYYNRYIINDTKKRIVNDI